MKVKNIHHVAIRVKDKQAACKLYSELFELKFEELGESRETDTRGAIADPGVEIIEPVTPGGAMAKSIEKYGQGLALLSFEIEDLDTAVAELKARNIRIIANLDRDEFRGVILHPADVFGVSVELIEYKKHK